MFPTSLAVSIMCVMLKHKFQCKSKVFLFIENKTDGMIFKPLSLFLQSEQGQLYPFMQAPPRWENFDSRR